MISSIIDDVSLKQSCTLGSDLMSLVPHICIYNVSEDGSITNSSFICFQEYIMIFSTLASVFGGSNISVLTCFVMESPTSLILGLYS